MTALLLWLLLFPLVQPAWLWGMARAGVAYEPDGLRAISRAHRAVYAAGAVALTTLLVLQMVLAHV